MARKKVVLTSEAKQSILEILDFYIQQNGNAVYSNKLAKQIKSTIKLIAQYNFMDKQTNLENIRVYIQERNAIFYEFNNNKLIVHLVWDCRRDPNQLIQF
jgi:plasmid stabilization system protein ParE